MVFLPLLFGVFFLRDTGRWSALATLVGGSVAAVLLGQLVPAYSSVMTLGAAIVLFAAGHVVDRHLARP